MNRHPIKKMTALILSLVLMLGLVAAPFERFGTNGAVAIPKTF